MKSTLFGVKKKISKIIDQVNIHPIIIFSFLEHFDTGKTTVGHTNGAPVHDSTMISMVDMVDKETPLANMRNHLT